MSGVSTDEIGQPEKGRCFAAYPPTRAGLAANLIHWLWPLGRVWAPAIMPLTYFVFFMAVSLGFCMLKHLQYILWFNCAHYYMFYICGCEAHFVMTIFCQ